MKNIFSIIILALAVLGFQSCSETETQSMPASFIELYSNGAPMADSFTVPMANGKRMIGVRCDSAAVWTAQTDQEWVKLSNHEGYGYGKDSTFYVRIDIDKNEGVRREAKINFTSGSVTKTLTISQKGSDMDPGDPFESAYNVVENFKLGYNLGNTLDSDPDMNNSPWFTPTSDLDWETQWGQPKTSQKIVDAIMGMGMNVMRIPVTWHPHMDADGNVSEVWMNRVKEVVDMVLSHEGCYVILNVQHDSGASNGRTDGGGWLNADPAKYAENSARFKKLWTQIAVAFKDYDQHLLFEAFNEILDGKDNWGDPSSEVCDVVNKLEQDFVDAVRATGGNNEWRNLVVNPYSAGSTAAKLNGMQAPEDIHPNHILASIHSYDPYWFCNDSDDDTYYIYMFDESCTAEIDQIFERVDTRFNELGIPYFFGEFGAIGTHPDMAERVKYAQYMAQKMNQYKTTGLWWMGLIQRRGSMKVYEQEIVDMLINTLDR